MVLIRIISTEMHSHNNVSIKVKHVPGKTNIISLIGFLSRLEYKKFKASHARKIGRKFAQGTYY